MRNQLFHPNFFTDLSKLTLRRVFKTDQGWVMEADGRDSAVCPGCQSISRSRRSRYWRSLQRPSCPGYSGDLQAACRSLALPQCWLPAANFHPTSLEDLCSPRATDQAIQRDHRYGGTCPGRTSRPAFYEQARDAAQRGHADPPSQESGGSKNWSSLRRSSK
jgi:hypothetical protein